MSAKKRAKNRQSSNTAREVELGYDWDQLANVECVSEEPDKLVVYLRRVCALCDRELPDALCEYERDLPIDPASSAKRERNINTVRTWLKFTRVNNRRRLQDSVPLDATRYGGEVLSIATMCWLLETQCLLLAYLITNRHLDARTADDFVRSDARLLGVLLYARVPVLQLTASQTRMALLGIGKNWTRVPMLSEAFDDYLRLLMLRISMLQALVFQSDAPGQAPAQLDYPKWRRALSKRHYRSTCEMFAATELYMYYIDQQRSHEWQIRRAAKPLPPEAATSMDAARLREWLDARREQILFEQLRRQVYEQSMLLEVLPHERETYQRENPQGYTDAATILTRMRESARQAMGAMVRCDIDALYRQRPLVTAVEHMTMLLLAEAGDFTLSDYVLYSTDFTEHPSVGSLTRDLHPRIYVPQTNHSIYVIVDGQIYTCEYDIYMALAALLRAMIGLWKRPAVRSDSPAVQRFEALRAMMMRPGYKAPVGEQVPAQSAPAPEPAVPVDDAFALLARLLDQPEDPAPADDEDDESSDLALMEC